MVDDELEVDRLIAEARDLIVDLNDEFDWCPGQPYIADRLFNTNVYAVLAQARSTKHLDVRTRRMIAVMRSFARAANGGRDEYAKVDHCRGIGNFEATSERPQIAVPKNVMMTFDGDSDFPQH